MGVYLLLSNYMNAKTTSILQCLVFHNAVAEAVLAGDEEVHEGPQ